MDIWNVCASIIQDESSHAPQHYWGHGMCVLAIVTLLRRAHCRTIEGMECVCEHYSRCVVARTAAAAALLGHGMCVRALFTLRRRA
jgi:hypothetical protein